MQLINLVGKRFGRLTVIERQGSYKSGDARWLCECDCGNFTYSTGVDLKRRSKDRSCGCYRAEEIKERATTHGKTGTKVHKCWAAMVSRCLTPTSQAYANYGGRGITVAEEWLLFENFYADMGEPPAKEFSIDRLDNEKGYSKDNCAWKTVKEQNRNRRSNRQITFRGITKTLVEWAELTGLHRACISKRIDAGWDVGTALTTPTQKNRYKANFNPSFVEHIA